MIDFAPQTSKRAYHSLADYATQQGAPESAFIAAGWQLTTYKNRPALQYPTATGPRWRYLDGGEKRHDSPFGYKGSWYGLKRAIELSTGNKPLIMVNGAAGVIVAQHFGIPAFAVSDGESRNIPVTMLDELKAAWHGEIIIALDCDGTGQKSAAKRARQLIDADLITHAVNLQLGDNGDIADFCKIYRAGAFDHLLTLPEIAPAAPKKAYKPREGGIALNSTDDRAKRIAAKWLYNDLAELARATSGRREILKSVAVKIGGLVKGEYVSSSEAERGLMNAAATCGLINKYSEREILRTVGDCFAYATATVIQLPPDSPHTGRRSKAHTKPTIQPANNILSFEPLPPARQPCNRADVAGWGVGYWTDGIPDAVRSALLGYLPKGAAIAAEIQNRAVIDGMINPQGFSRDVFADAAKSMGYDIPNTTLFRYLTNLEGVFNSVLGIESSVLNTIPKNGFNSKSAGRRSILYAVMPADKQRKAIEDFAYPRFIERYHPTDGDSVIATMYESTVEAIDTTEDKSALALELAAVIDASASTQEIRKTKAGIYARRAYERFQKSLDNPYCSHLPDGWEIANESDYIVAFAHALGTGREGERISLNDWSRLLGISVNSVPKYLIRAGLGKVEQPQYEYVHIEIAENIVKEVSAKAKSHKAYPRWIVVRDQYDNEITSADYNPATAPKIAKQYRVLGCKVEVKMQAANAYQVVSELPVEVQKPAVDRIASVDPVITLIEPDFEVIRPFREPRLNPAWVAGQFRLVLQQRGRWLDNWRFIDQFGEIVETKEPLELAELIINRHIASNQTRRAVESEMLADGWRKVSA